MHVGTDSLPNGITNAGISYPDFLDWRSRSRSFSGLALFVGMAAFLTALALTASLLPARRAANTDPLRALRYQ